MFAYIGIQYPCQNSWQAGQDSIPFHPVLFHPLIQFFNKLCIRFISLSFTNLNFVVCFPSSLLLTLFSLSLSLSLSLSRKVHYCQENFSKWFGGTTKIILTFAPLSRYCVKCFLSGQICGVLRGNDLPQLIHFTKASSDWINCSKVLAVWNSATILSNITAGVKVIRWLDRDFVVETVAYKVLCPAPLTFGNGFVRNSAWYSLHWTGLERFYESCPYRFVLWPFDGNKVQITIHKRPQVKVTPEEDH